MSNPLNEQIAAEIIEITQLETERDRIRKQLDEKGMFPLSAQPPAFVERYRPAIETVERLNQTIDSTRQKLVSLELLMLDNSINDLHLATKQLDGSIKSLEATTSRVDGSVKSLQGTTGKLLESSNKLERLTTLLIYITILLAIIAIYQVTLTLGESNALYGAVGGLAALAALIYFMYRVYQAEKRGDLASLSRPNQSSDVVVQTVATRSSLVK